MKVVATRHLLAAGAQQSVDKCCIGTRRANGAAKNVSRKDFQTADNGARMLFAKSTELALAERTQDP